MNPPRESFDAHVFSKQPDYDEVIVRREFARAVPLRTVVVYCYDPRAVGIPAAVAAELGEEYPGQITLDENGRKVASSTTLFPVVVAGGRAIDALRSITVAQHLFGIENVVVVHHTQCGATSFTPDGLIAAWHHEQGADLAGLYERESLAISDYVDSLRHDTQLVRRSPGTPRHVNVHGYVFDIDDGRLTRVFEDRGVPTMKAG